MSQGEKKKLGLKDKILKMLDSDSPKEGSNNSKGRDKCLQASNIKFTLSGGSVHSELLVAEAVLDAKDDENCGMPLPIVCKWFNKSRTDEIIEIEGITGAFYQPNADDVNSYIMVEALPILENNEYKGEPLRREVGPLVLDKQVQEEVQELLEAGRFKVAAKLEAITDVVDDHVFPLSCSLQIDTENITITVPDKDIFSFTCPLLSGSSAYPSVRIIKRTNNAFEFAVGLNKFYRISAQSSNHRDVIAVAFRMFSGKRLLTYKEQKKQRDMNSDQNAGDTTNSSSQNSNSNSESVNVSNEDLTNSRKENVNAENNNSKNNSSNNLNTCNCSSNSKSKATSNNNSSMNSSESFEIFVKLNELTKKSGDLEALRDDLKYRVNELTAEVLRFKEKLQKADGQLSETRDSLRAEKEENEALKQKHAQYMHEKLFLTQESQVMQEEVANKTQELEKLKKYIEEISKPKEQTLPVVDQKTVEQLENTVMQLEQKLTQQAVALQETQEKLSLSENKANEAVIAKETLTNEVNHLKKKYECLQQEKGISLRQQSQLFDTPELQKNGSLTFSHNSLQKENELGSDNKCSSNIQPPIPYFNSEFRANSHNSKIDSSTGSASMNKSSNAAGTPASGVFSFPNDNNLQIKSNSLNLSPLRFNLPQISSNASVELFPPKKQESITSEQLQDINILKEELKAKMEDNHALLQKISRLEAALLSLSQQDQKGNSPSKKKATSPGNEQILQKLVNSLTELITDKDLALENQKKINKELMIKIQQLSTQQQQQTKS